MRDRRTDHHGGGNEDEEAAFGRALAFLDTETGGREQTHEGVLHGPGMAPDVSGDAGDKDGGGGAAPAGGGKRG